MKDLGDYLYLIFIVIAVISSVFGKKKKKDSRDTSATPPPATNWEQVLRKLTNTSEEESVVQAEEMQVVSPQAPATTKIDIAKETLHEEGGSVFSHQPASLSVNSPTDLLEESVIDLDLSDSDDARKAIIYAEIFKRK